MTIIGLLQQYSGVGKFVHPDSSGEGSKIGDVPDEPRQWQAFEQADLMEQGLAAGLVCDFMEIPEKDKEVRLCVERSPDRKKFLLTTEKGNCCLLAESDDSVSGYNIYVARDGDPPVTVGPMFTLRANDKKDKWTLHANTCDQCEMKGKRNCGSRELAQIFHYTEQVGDAVAEIHCMDMEIPKMLDDDSMDVWCPMCSGGGTDLCTQLTSRRPKWNARRRTISMDFWGRCSMASAKNFQLEVVDKPDKVKFLFGKVGDHQFVLDYHRPLSTIQAFAAAVSAFNW